MMRSRQLLSSGTELTTEVHTLNITYRTVQNINTVRARRESTYKIRVDGQVFVGVYEKENVTNVSLENRTVRQS